MTCPTCQKQTRVLDSRFRDGEVYRRRRCKNGHRFSTLERVVPQCDTGLHGFGNLYHLRAAKKRRDGAWKEFFCECGKWHLTPVEKTDKNFQQI